MAAKAPDADEAAAVTPVDIGRSTFLGEWLPYVVEGLLYRTTQQSHVERVMDFLRKVLKLPGATEHFLRRMGAQLLARRARACSGASGVQDEDSRSQEGGAGEFADLAKP